MESTENQKEFWDFAENADFISFEKIKEFNLKLKEEDNADTWYYGLKVLNFTKCKCPSCKTEGYFKSNFFGKLNHPDCNYSWHMNPFKYLGIQLKKAFNVGVSFGAQEKDGEKPGCITSIFLFLFGFIIRLPFSIVLTLIESIMYLTNKKPIKN